MSAVLRSRIAVAAFSCVLAASAPVGGSVQAGVMLYTGVEELPPYLARLLTDEPPIETIGKGVVEFDPGTSDRLALVISTQRYNDPRYRVLETSTEDGNAIALALRQLGYRVMRVRDADRSVLVSGLDTFAQAVTKESTVVLYYSGLGVALPIERDNRIIPADFPGDVPDTPSSAWQVVSSGTLALDADVLSGIKRRSPKALTVFYDACRSDPLSEVTSMQRYDDTASCKPTPIRNAAVLYASAPGTASMRRLSMSDQSVLSVFPRAILAALREDPALRIDAMMQWIKDDVRASASKVGDKQNPPVRIGLSAALLEEGVCIAPINGRCVEGEEAPDSTNAVPDPAEKAAWSACLDSDEVTQCEDYLRRFSDGDNAAKAKRRIAELKADVIAMNNATYVPLSGEDTTPGNVDVAAILHACDELAAHPGNKENAEDIEGVLYGGIDGPKALPACLRAAEVAPKVLRIRYQLARAKQAAGQQKDAIKDLLRLAEQEQYPAAMNNLGAAYQMGIGVTKSYGEAARWYEVAANEGFVPSMAILGWMYQAGRGVPKNNTKAFSWYLKAAEGGAASAMHNVGFMYQNGWGTEKNDAIAAEWFEKAAGEGFAQAMSMAGWLYQTGRGVPKDVQKAADFYRAGADKDEPSSMSALGSLYDSGDGGIRRAPDEAAQWLVKALGAGHEATRARLTDQPKTLRADTRRAVQEALQELGFDPGPADGVFGQKTRDAVNAAFKAK